MNQENESELISQRERFDFHIQESELDQQVIRELKTRLTADLRPVRALPSDGKLITLLVLFLAVFTALAAWPVHYIGLRALTPTQLCLYFGVIAAAVILCAVALVQEMIPGSRRRIDPFIAIAAAVAGLVGTVMILFPSFDATRFVRIGARCFRYGSICGFICGLLLALLLRRASFTSPFRGTIAACFLASLAGVAVLAMHCPMLTASHILVWHLGVLLLGISAGAGLGEIARI